MFFYTIARRVSFTSLLIALFAFTAGAQFRSPFGSTGGNDIASVSGTVLNVGIGNRLSVVLDSASGSYGGYRTELGQQGQFSFMGVPAGTYVVKVIDLYGNIVGREFVNVNRMTPPVRIELPAKKTEAAKASTISIQRLAHKVPKDARKEFERAEKAAAKDEMEKSLKHLRKAVNIDPEYFEAHVNLGARLIRMGKPAEALTSFESALRLDENNSVLFSNTATALLMLKRAEEAERAARSAIELDPLNVRARYMFGLSLLDQGKDVGEAVTSLQRISDNFPYARVALAQAFAAQGKRNEAILELQAYLDSGRPENRDQVKTWLTSLNTVQ